MSRKFNWKYLIILIAAINIVMSGCASDKAASASGTDINNNSEGISTEINTSGVYEEELSDNPASDEATILTSAVYELAGGISSKDGEDIASTEENKSAVKVFNSGKLELLSLKIVTEGKTTSENESNLYGLNAGVLAESGSEISLNGCEVITSGDGATAIFATGTNAKITLNNAKMNTSGNSAKGLYATYKGTIAATNCTINTTGINCAAIATGRGEGTVNVIGGSMETSGVNSPAVYSTGIINVTGATLKANGSEAAVIEGKNSITLTDADITGTKNNGVMLYQNTSEGAYVGTSIFNMVSGSLTSSEGALFYITNTSSVINLNNVKINNSTDVLISSVSDKWGKENENGGNVEFNANFQSISGNVVCDNLSTVSFNLKNSTNYTGTINGNCAGKSVSISIDATSIWNLTGDSYVTILTDGLTALSNIKDNGYNIYYDSSNDSNAWLEGKTIALSGGGKLTPDKSKGDLT